MNENKEDIKFKGSLRKRRSAARKKRIWILALISVLVCIFILACAASAFRPKVSTTPPFIDPGSEDGGNTVYERKEDFYTFLVCGTDKVSNNTDVMMLVSIDKVSKAVSIIQIPRDTYINRDNADFRVTRVYRRFYCNQYAYYRDGRGGRARWRF